MRPVAVITGAAQGIGAHLARRFAAAGYDVVLTDRLAAVQDVADQVGGVAHVFDLTEDEAIEAFGRAVPRCDVLVNNAALTLYDSLLDTTSADALRVLHVNLVAPLAMTRALSNQLASSRRGGAIVNLSSVVAHYHPPSTGMYSSSKAGLEGLTRALALELGQLGVRCNAVAPGIVPTDGSADHYGTDDERRRRGAVLPLQRLGHTDDIADAVLFLASPAASYITGQWICVDGGHTIAGGDYFRRARQSLAAPSHPAP